MIYVYREAASEGANELVEDICLLGIRARRTQGKLLQNAVAGDAVVCWGGSFRAPANIRTLNNVAIVNKFEEAQKLAAAGVPTITVSRRRPEARAGVRPAFALPANRNLNEVEARNLAQRIQAHLNEPVQPADTWLARRNNHIGGSDLLNPPGNPDFYSKKENIIDEFRLHMFKGKSIRAGHKIQRPNRPNGGPAHAWIRSFDAGWIIQYADFASTRQMREIAQAAVTALGLDFGAVDIGKRADGTLIVLEVNRAPGVENGTSEAYARKIVEWVRG